MDDTYGLHSESGDTGAALAKLAQVELVVSDCDGTLLYTDKTLRVAFVLDCCDREVMGFVATTGGLSGGDVRDLMAASVKHRFGRIDKRPHAIEWLTDNGSCYTAQDTCRFARDIALVPRTTPVESPQSNGMAEAFVRTLKRDYARVSVRPDAQTVIDQLPI